MTTRNVSRRRVLAGAAATAGLGAVAGALPTRFAIGAQAPVKVGLMLPYSGTYAKLGNNITDGFKLRLAEANNLLGGRDFEIVAVDDESAPPKAKDNAARLCVKEKVDVLVGTVHSGVAVAMAQVAREEQTLTIIPNAGANMLTGRMCAPNLFRSSFSNWQPSYPAGSVAIADGHKRAVVMSWNYPAGHEAIEAFTESFTAGGGEVVGEILPEFPNVEFQPYLTEIAALEPDCVFVFFAGGGALKFLKDYAAAGLQGRIALYSPGFLTDGVYREAGAAAEGVKTTLHYADALGNPTNRAFRKAFAKTFGREADVYAVQGYDAANLLLAGAEGVEGDLSARSDLYAAIESATIDSPRGPFTLSGAHNPIQDIYLRQVVQGEEKVLGVAHKALEDPARGCRLA